jgi:hypothetical protein
MSAALFGSGGSGYEMLDGMYQGGSVGGLRTRLVGVNSGGQTLPVLRIRGSGFGLYGLDIYGRQKSSWDSAGPRAVACIQMEGSAANNPGRATIRDCNLYEAQYGIQTLAGYYNDSDAFISDENHADLSLVDHCNFFNVESVFRSENQQSIHWKFHKILVESVGNVTPYETVVFDIERGGFAIADTVTINHGKVVLLRLKDYSPHQCAFDIHNIYWDRSPVSDPTNYMTLIKHDGTGWAGVPWRVRITGGLGDYDTTRWDASRLVQLNPDNLLGTTDMFVDVSNMPTSKFALAGSGPFRNPDPTKTPLYAEILKTSAHWPLDESTGITAYERTHNGVDGTLNGSVSWVAGKSGNAASFPAGAHNISIPDNTAIRLYTNSTISFWVWLNAWTSGVVLSKTNSALSGFRVESGTPNHFYLSEGGGNKYDFVTGGLGLGAWYHVAVTLDASGSPVYKAYLNGTQVSTGTMTGGAWLGDACPLRIGSAVNAFYSSGTNSANMLVDGVRAHKRVLSANAVAEIYNAGI